MRFRQYQNTYETKWSVKEVTPNFCLSNQKSDASQLMKEKKEKIHFTYIFILYTYIIYIVIISGKNILISI